MCGCAGKPVDTPPNLVSDMPTASDSVTTGALQGSGYQLSEEELKFDCKKLTGTMQIRILQIRGYDTNKKTRRYRAASNRWRRRSSEAPKRAPTPTGSTAKTAPCSKSTTGSSPSSNAGRSTSTPSCDDLD